MAFFKKQRLRYQKWLNSFVVKHHDKWYMPLITIGLGASYLALFAAIILTLSIILTVLIKLFGWWVLYTVLVVWAVYGVGMFVRIPGDSEYERNKKS